MKSGDITINDPNEVSADVVNHFTKLFTSTTNVLQNDMVQEVIPHLITDRINNVLTFLPSLEEIKNVVFSLNKDSAPGPDGFGALFFQKYWEIINQDVYKAVIQFFTTGWLLPNFNTNILVLIPKTNNAGSMDQYRPIAIANFKFKIITKILADMLASIMPAIKVLESFGFNAIFCKWIKAILSSVKNFYCYQWKAAWFLFLF